MGFNQDIQHKGYYVHILDGAILFQKKKGANHGSEASLSHEEKRESFTALLKLDPEYKWGRKGNL